MNREVHSVERAQYSSVRGVVDRRLCTQCGTCAGVCPSRAISLVESVGGLLLPVVRDDLCTLCGTCLRSCPGLGLRLDLSPGVDPFVGTVIHAYRGHATDPRIRDGAQSGGLATALSLYLLSIRAAEAVLVTTMPADGSLRPRPVLARTPDEVMAAQGSKYCAAGGNRLLAELREDLGASGDPHSCRDARPGGGIAVVALPCQIHGLEKAARAGLPQAGRVSCRIGLFCDRVLLSSCIEQMLLDAGIERKNAVLLRYRSKARSGWPGEVEIVRRSGESLFFPSSLRTGLKDLFTPPRCRLCIDKINVFCDVALGDPWGISEDPEGDSVALVRTPRGEGLVKDAQRAGLIELSEIDPSIVFHHQGLAERRRAFAAYSRIWASMGRDLPAFEGLNPEDAGVGDGIYRRRLEMGIRVAESPTAEEALRQVAKYRKRTAAPDRSGAQACLARWRARAARALGLRR